MKSTIFNIKIKIVFSVIQIVLAPIKYFLILLYIIFKKKYSQGYEYFKWMKIDQLINSKSRKLKIDGIYNLDERVIEYKWIFNELKKSKKIFNLLDAGSTLNFPQIINKIKLRYKITIQTLYPENYAFYEDGVSYIYEDLTKKNFNKNFFDIITCISTLEHVGYDNSKYNIDSKKTFKKNNSQDYLKVIENFKFSLKKKGLLLITMPYGTYREFNNLQVFDDRKIKKIINKFNPQKFYLRYATYNNGCWKECTNKECLSNEKKLKIKYANKNNFELKSAHSVALIKLIK